jgi:hypothetical protein
MPVVPGRMDDRKDNDGILPNHKEDPVGKPAAENPAHLRHPAQQWEKQRSIRRPPNGDTNFPHQLQAQAAQPLLIPKTASVMSASASGRTMRRRLMP